MLEIGILTIIRAVEQSAYFKNLNANFEVSVIDADGFSFEVAGKTSFIARFEPANVSGGLMFLYITVCAMEVETMLTIGHHLENVFGKEFIKVLFD
jgi:hypothetical protein